MNRNIYIIISIALFALSYIFNYNDRRDELHDRINSEFKREAPTWGDSIMIIHDVYYYSSETESSGFPKNKNLYIEFEQGKIVISPKFYNPDNYATYQKDQIHISLLEDDEYHISTTDSLFKNMLTRLGIKADVATAVYARSLFDMFISEDSMNVNAPYVRIFRAREVEGFATDSVSLGICGQGKMVGTVNIPAIEIVKGMELLAKWQFAALALIALLYLPAIYVPEKLRYMQNVKFIGNSCIDFNTNTVYYWNGGKLSLTDKRAEVLKVFVDSAPEYRLLKEDICRRIWNRDGKDGQALYNVAMSELRSYLIAEDDSLELKTQPNEGVVLVVDKKRIRKFPLLHFIGRIKGLLSLNDRELKKD